MKAFIALFALVASVSADADPQVFYTAANTAVYGALTPFTYNYNGVLLKSSPCENNLKQAVPCAHGLSHYAYAPNLATYSALVHPTAAYGIVKRDADAEPQAYFNSVGALTYLAANNRFVYNGIASVGCSNNDGALVPCASGYKYYVAPTVATTAAVPAVATYSAAAVPAVATTAAVASPAVVSSYSGYYPSAFHYLKKRESEPEADPAYFAVPTAYAAHPGYALAGPYGYGYAAASPYAVAGVGLVHTSRLGVCLNYLNQQVSC